MLVTLIGGSMKKLALVACLYAGCVSGMHCSEEADVIDSKITMSDVQNVEGKEDRSLMIDVNNPNLIEQWQGINDVISEGDVEEVNAFETSASTYKEGRFWTIVRKVFQPVQITTSASTMVFITASEAIKAGNPAVSTGLAYVALGSAVTSGVLSLFISKMNSRITKLNRIYKSKLAAEKIIVDTRDV